MNTTKYLETLGDNVWLVIVKIFPNGGYIFQDDNAPCHASRRAVQWSLCDLLPQLHFEFPLKLSYTSSEYKLELVQPISFSPPSQEFFLFKMSHLEFCSLILIVLHTFSIIFKSGD
jgi:hypothetical protein